MARPVPGGLVLGTRGRVIAALRSMSGPLLAPGRYGVAGMNVEVTVAGTTIALALVRLTV